MNDNVTALKLPGSIATGAVLLGESQSPPASLSLVRSATVDALPNDQDTDTIPAVEAKPEPAVHPPEETPKPGFDLSTTALVDNPEPVAPTTQPEPAAPDLFGAREWPTRIAVIATTAFSAVGQVLFFGPFFAGIFAESGMAPPGPNIVGWLLAVFIGGALEWSMIVFADHGIRNRDGQSKGWRLPFGVGVAIALMTMAINVGHWYSYSMSAAVMFAAVGATGFAVHASEGLFRVAAVNRERDRVRAENARLQRVYEQELAEWRQAGERQRQREHELNMAKVSAAAAYAPAKKKEEPKPAQDDADQVDEQPSEPEPQRPAAKPSTSKKNGKKKLTPEIARKWADANGAPGSRPEPSVVIKHFESQGYEVPSPRSVRRWFEDYDKQQAEAAAS